MYKSIRVTPTSAVVVVEKWFSRGGEVIFLKKFSDQKARRRIDGSSRLTAGDFHACVNGDSGGENHSISAQIVHHMFDDMLQWLQDQFNLILRQLCLLIFHLSFSAIRESTDAYIFSDVELGPTLDHTTVTSHQPVHVEQNVGNVVGSSDLESISSYILSDDELGVTLDRLMVTSPHGRHFLGAMDVQCSKCSALHWLDERLCESTPRKPHFGIYCNKGKNKLPPLKPLLLHYERYMMLEIHKGNLIERTCGITTLQMLSQVLVPKSMTRC